MHGPALLMSDAGTPLMRQYHAIKEQVPNALLMFRLGDFYELFYDDAVTAARELEITLTARNKEKGQPIPMCGVPYHSAENYLARLIQKGYRVAMCDQMEEASAAKKTQRTRMTSSAQFWPVKWLPQLLSEQFGHAAVLVNPDDRLRQKRCDRQHGDRRALLLGRDRDRVGDDDLVDRRAP